MANRKFCDVLALGCWLAVLSRVDAIALVPFSKKRSLILTHAVVARPGNISARPIYVLSGEMV